MAENSKIEWTHHTFNPWIGCTKISPGCDNCYAEGTATRFKMAEWGAGKPRKEASENYWKQPLKWNSTAQSEGRRVRVFCASMADVFDNEVHESWRVRLWAMVYDTPHLDWLILTKRIGNAGHMLPLGAFREGPVPNLWLGATVVNQEEADRDIPKLLEAPAKVRFLSMEPLLGPVDLTRLDIGIQKTRGYGEKQIYHDCLNGWDFAHNITGQKKQHWAARTIAEVARINWVICGGESGSKARMMNPEWARSLRDQCKGARVSFFMKQMTGKQPIPDDLLIREFPNDNS